MTSVDNSKDRNSNRIAYPSKIFTAWVVALLVIVFFVIYIDVNTPIIIISGSSMTPNILPGDIALIKEEHINDIKIGDVIAFRSGEDYQSSNNRELGSSDTNSDHHKTVIHRVVDVTRDKNNFVFLTTRGDFNFQSDDQLVTESNYIGEAYLVIPKVGNVITLLKNPIVIAVMAIFLIIFYLYGNNAKKIR